MVQRKPESLPRLVRRMWRPSTVSIVDEIKKQQDAYSDITNKCIYKAGKCEDYRQVRDVMLTTL
jgi:hypothetical protein